MTTKDTYKTIVKPSEDTCTGERNKSIIIALSARTLNEIEAHLEMHQKKYYDVRCIHYAYVLGTARKDLRANDNDEPSGMTGKPILEQTNSSELTNILIVVIHYLDGIELETSGLIVAYGVATAKAISAVTIIGETIDEEVTVMLEYPLMNDIMRIAKEEEPGILSQSYDIDCNMTLYIRRSIIPELCARLEKVKTVRIFDEK